MDSFEIANSSGATLSYPILPYGGLLAVFLFKRELTRATVRPHHFTEEAVTSAPVQRILYALPPRKHAILQPAVRL